MALLYRLFMGLCGLLCALMMLVVGQYGVALVLASCVLLVLFKVPERVGRLLDGGDDA